MPKAYWISAYRSIKDPAKLAAYAKLAPPATTKFGAKYLCRGVPQMTYEAGEKERIVITEFPSLKARDRRARLARLPGRVESAG